MPHTNLHLHVVLTRKKKIGESGYLPKIEVLFRKYGKHWLENNFLLALLCHGSGSYSPSCIAEPGHVRFLVLGQTFLRILRLSPVTIRKSGSSRRKVLLKCPVPYDHAIYRQFRLTNQHLYIILFCTSCLNKSQRKHMCCRGNFISTHPKYKLDSTIRNFPPHPLADCKLYLTAQIHIYTACKYSYKLATILLNKQEGNC